MIYRRRPTPLHAARAAAGASWCAALALAALLESNPIVLGAITVTLLAGGALAGVARELRRAARLALPLGVAIALVNALVSREGLTVIWRFGQLPLVGHLDVTLEATAYGGVLGLRAVALILCGALYTTAVDPDEVLRLFGRVSPRSALTATLATRMVGILARDARRLADAQRCRPGPPPGRVALMRATTSGVLDRALDVAAALEVRGYALTGRRRGARRPWSRHDLAFTASALAVALGALATRLAGATPFTAYPALSVPAGAGVLAVAAGLAACALIPFLDRRGVVR